MNNYEKPITRWYWRQVGGTLVEEFPAVTGTASRGRRSIDGIILPNRPHEILDWRKVSLEGEDVIVVQTKRSRLGMNLMGQTFFSAKLIERFNPRSVRAVALCKAHDSVLSPMLKSFPNMEVVIYPGEVDTTL